MSEAKISSGFPPGCKMLRVVLFALVLIATCSEGRRGDTALDEYVQRPETVTNLEFLYTLRDDELRVTTHVTNFTSVYWMDETVSDRPLWWHYLQIVIPDEIRYTDHGFFYVSEYTNEQDPPGTPGADYFLPLAKQVANQTGAVAILLNQIPNGPFRFPDDPMEEEKESDSAIAFTMKKYVVYDNSSDPEVLLLFPMCKAAVLGMTAAEQYAFEETNGEVDIASGGWIMSGASKRAWTTYLATATDPDERVKAIGPMVFSMLDSVESLNKHYQSYKGWSWAFNPYWRENITQFLNEPETEEMFSHIDPFAYNDRLDVPKYVIQSSGDEFFLPDDTHLFWDDLIGQKHFLMLENTNHPMIGHHDRLVNALVTFFIANMEGFQFPSVTWTRSTDSDARSGKIVLETDIEPLEIIGWYADTTNLTEDRRDFRKFIGPDPESPNFNPCDFYTVAVDGDGLTYELEMGEPEEGQRAFFISGVWEGPEGLQFDFTSEIVIIEDTFPVERCEGWDCYGELV